MHRLPQVHQGVLRKNEQYEEDMIDILQWLHPYVPGHSDDDDANKKPIKVLSGGDYLTFERSIQIHCQTLTLPVPRILFAKSL